MPSAECRVPSDQWERGRGGCCSLSGQVMNGGGAQSFPPQDSPAAAKTRSARESEIQIP